MLLTFAWPVDYHMWDVEVARERGWLRCSFRKCDFWEVEAVDVTVARVDMHKMVGWAGEEELRSLCEKLYSVEEWEEMVVGGEEKEWVDLPASTELRSWLARVFYTAYKKVTGVILVLGEDRGPEMMISVQGLLRDEWQRPVVEIVFRELDDNANLQSIIGEPGPDLMKVMSDGGLRLLRSLLGYCQRLNETTPWQRRMMADVPECLASFLPMLDGTAGAEGRMSLASNSLELSRMLHLREPMDGENQDVRICPGCASETSNLEGRVKVGEVGKGAKEGKVGRMKLETCDGCGAGRGEKKLSRCARCMEVGYCSKECQTNRWKEHRSVCLKGE